MSYIDRAFVDQERKYWRIPGAAVALFGEGIEDEIACFGYRDLERSLPFTENTLHCVASCSKSMTSLLIASLVADGILDYDRPVAEYLPDFQLFDPDASKRFTLRDMLCHRTGFGDHDVLWPCDRADLARRIRYVEPCDTFRNRSLYSNVIYALIGYVAEAVTGRSWPELMQERVFDPLRMQRTNCTADKIVSDPDHAEPYYVEGGRAVKKAFWNIDGGGPAASVNTSIKDLMKWVKFHIRGGCNEEGKQIIPSSIFEEMHRPQMPFTDTEGSQPYPFDFYCMGWRAGKYKGYRAQKHSGKIEGYSSFQLYLPDEKIGLCLMANLHVPFEQFCFTVTYSLLDAALGLPKDDWRSRYRGKENTPETGRTEGVTADERKTNSTAEQGPADEDVCPDPAVFETYKVDVAEKKLDPAVKGNLCPRAYKEYIGIYANPGHGPLEVRAAGRELTLHYRDQTLALHHYGADTFVMPGVLTDTLTLRVPVRFVANAYGEIIKVKICYEPQVEDIVFVKERSGKEAGEKTCD